MSDLLEKRVFSKIKLVSNFATCPVMNTLVYIYSRWHDVSCYDNNVTLLIRVDVMLSGWVVLT